MVAQTGRGTFICWYCNEGLQDKRQLEIHIKIEHSQLVYGQSEWYACKPCQKLYKRQQDIVKHMRQCHGITVIAKSYLIKNSTQITVSCKLCGIDNLLLNQCKTHASCETQNLFRCNFCKEVFEDKRVLESHIYIKHGNGNASLKCYLCQICCDELYVDEEQFKKHMLEIHELTEVHLDKYIVETLEDVLVPCRCCSKSCLVFSGFCKEHDVDMKVNSCHSHPDSAHGCAVCHITFPDCALLWKHKFSEHEIGQWQCNLCTAHTNVDSPRDLMNHWSTSHGNGRDDSCEQHGDVKVNNVSSEMKKFVCIVCGASYVKWKGLREHCVRKHTVMIQTILPTPSVSRDVTKSSAQFLDDEGHMKYKCDTCSKTFSMYSGLMRHVQAHSCHENKLDCTYCKKSFSQKVHLSRHYKNIHGVLMQANEVAEMKLQYGITIDGVTSYKCPHCTSLFARFFSLRKHLRSHSGVRPFICTICNKSFVQRNHLNRHTNIHTGPGYQCNICGRVMNDRTNLKVHMRNHTGEKKYICEVCGKGFVQWSSHYYHMFTHSESRNFQCTVCDKKFATPAGLREHKRVHVISEEKHICETCGNSFSSRRNLLYHIKIHTTDRPYKCEMCSTTFKMRKYLVQHYKTHRHNK
ncbi:hypothetical protein M8J75_010463 [Diaphorina citri]|nr:hypothetical protein M8J75_010463 [Diaphorina citri]KAI5746437.1 hypothetical protein M8J77_003536 [Diaphorina citri]